MDAEPQPEAFEVYIKITKANAPFLSNKPLPNRPNRLTQTTFTLEEIFPDS